MLRQALERAVGLAAVAQRDEVVRRADLNARMNVDAATRIDAVEVELVAIDELPHHVRDHTGRVAIERRRLDTKLILDLADRAQLAVRRMLGLERSVAAKAR